MSHSHEKIFSPDIEGRIDQLTNTVFQHIQEPYRYHPSIRADFDGDDGRLDYTLDTEQDLQLKFRFSAGGYSSQFGTNTWVEITSPEHGRTVVEASYLHPKTHYSSVIKEKKHIEDNETAEIILSYSEMAVSFFEADLARMALARQRGRTLTELSLLGRTSELEVDELTYFVSSEV